MPDHMAYTSSGIILHESRLQRSSHKLLVGKDKCHHLSWRLNLILCGFIRGSFFKLIDFVIGIAYQATLKLPLRRTLRIWDISGVLATPTGCIFGSFTVTNAHLLIHSGYTWFTAHKQQLHSICTVHLTHPGLFNISSNSHRLPTYRSIGALWWH